QRAKAAGMTLLDEGETTCCYAHSEKHWVTDPQGVAWEHFHTLDNIPVFNESKEVAAQSSVCCVPPVAPVQATSCCIPSSSSCCYTTMTDNNRALNVLFVCSYKSARSILAEA